MGAPRIGACVISLIVTAISVPLGAGPALAGPTALRWMQPAGTSASEFRVYAGQTPDAGAVVYQGLPVPDSSGIYSVNVQIDEIDQRIPVYVWVTAANAAGESPPSNATYYAAGDPQPCDLLVDADCDGIPDDGAPGDVACATGQSQGCDDNCPYAPNPGQEDTAGVGYESRPDGIGNACQCGDVDADGRVNLLDARMISNALMVPPQARMRAPDLCDVGGSLGCDIVDYAIILQSQAIPPTASVQQQCPPANPSP